MESYSNTYKEAGVDVTAGYKAVELMKKHVARTTIPGVVSGLGGLADCLSFKQQVWRGRHWFPAPTVLEQS